jgi:hypothetical protein
MLSAKQKLITLVIAILGSVFLPAISLLIFKKQGKVKDFYLDTKDERNLPYASSILYFLLAAYSILQFQNITQIFGIIFFNAALLVLVIFVINYYTKISAHMASLGSLAAYLYSFSFNLKIELIYWITATIVISGIVALARLKLQAHTKFQIYLGFFTGAIVTTLLLLLIF